MSVSYILYADVLKDQFEVVIAWWYARDRKLAELFFDFV